MPSLDCRRVQDRPATLVLLEEPGEKTPFSILEDSEAITPIFSTRVEVNHRVRYIGEMVSVFSQHAWRWIEFVECMTKLQTIFLDRFCGVEAPGFTVPVSFRDSHGECHLEEQAGLHCQNQMRR